MKTGKELRGGKERRVTYCQQAATSVAECYGIPGIDQAVQGRGRGRSDCDIGSVGRVGLLSKTRFMAVVIYRDTKKHIPGIIQLDTSHDNAKKRRFTASATCVADGYRC